MKNKTALIISLVLLLIGLSAVLLYANRDKWFGKKTDCKTSDGKDGKKDASGNCIAIVNITDPPEFPLQMGSNNQYVKKLQEYLLTKNANCLSKYGADGDWGDETESCVVSVLGQNKIDYSKYKSLGLA